MDIFSFNNYRTYLRELLSNKIAKNESFSLRAFSQHLGITHSSLSQVLNGKRHLSLQRALDISLKLGGLMKIFIFLVLLCFKTMGFAQSSQDTYYQFVKNFELIDVKIIGDDLEFTISHNASFSGNPSFKLVAFPICKESYPTQCSATLIRLDDPSEDTSVKTFSTYRQKWKPIWGDEDSLYLTIHAPNTSRTVLLNENKYLPDDGPIIVDEN